MKNPAWAVLIAATAVLVPAGAALANGARPPAASADLASGAEPNRTTNGEAPMEEVAGIRIVPSIMAREVNLRPSAWYLRGQSQTASATARVYTDRQGAITGLTLTAWGLPNPESINPMDRDYVVWLFNPETNMVKNIGVLDSYNAGKAVFGYTPDTPVVGYTRIVITPETNFAAHWPQGWQQLNGDIPQSASLPPSVNGRPLMNQPPERGGPAVQSRRRVPAAAGQNPVDKQPNTP